MLILLNEASASRFATRKWNNGSDQLNANYAVGNETIYSAEVLKVNLCNLSNAYILVKVDLAILACNAKK